MGFPHWFVSFNCLADRYLWPFETDRWRLTYHDPAHGTLGIEPLSDTDPPASLEDARWLADVLAYDHDAPVGITPSFAGTWPDRHPIDPTANPPSPPLGAAEGSSTTAWYWESLNQSYGAAADLRFSGSIAVRYDEGERAPSTDFTTRFQGREERVALYAMAARQPDLLSEYLCLYRLLEAADGTNGKAFASSHSANIETADFGELRVIVDMLDDGELNAFEVYRERAIAEVQRLAATGIDVSGHLYELRNSLAHGKHSLLTHSDGARFENAARALPVVKLLARIAVEPLDRAT